MASPYSVYATPPKPKAERPQPNIAGMKLLLKNGMKGAVQQMLDEHPELKYKIELNNGREPDAGEYILVDALTGAALWLRKFITKDEDLLAMKQDIIKLANCPDEVLITGETGTGKEIIARALLGDRTGAFKRINCGALPSELIESELFGHTVGAFTGATSNKKGLMEAAKDGVLFLDEIGDLPLMVQAKLLNCLQPIDGKKYVRPVGSNEEREINCRVVCATHKNIVEMMEKGLFRKDLYARISTFEVEIKPLSHRKGDIEPIVRYICETMKIESIAQPFLDKYLNELLNEDADLSLNVRSIEKMVKRFNVLGRI